jgi:hypothetical protein
MSDDEYDALKANVAARGVLQPVIVDENGEIIDGHHRAKVCDELGIEYPKHVLDGLDEDEKCEQALILNLGRRHLSTEQKRELVVKLSELGRSVRWISQATGISKSSVHRYLSHAGHEELDELAREWWKLALPVTELILAGKRESPECSAAVDDWVHAVMDMCACDQTLHDKVFMRAFDQLLEKFRVPL